MTKLTSTGNGNGEPFNNLPTHSYNTDKSPGSNNRGNKVGNLDLGGINVSHPSLRRCTFPRAASNLRVLLGC